MAPVPSASFSPLSKASPNHEPSSPRTAPVIGLTGPMCSGKNQAGDYLARRGFVVIDADQTARAAMELVEKRVIAEFQDVAHKKSITLVTPEGKIDRHALGSLIFPDPLLLARHEAIIYPEIDRLLFQEIDSHPDVPIVINAPLLHKSAVLDRCNWIFFIQAPSFIRLFRAIRRDSLPIAQILARFTAQKHLYAQYISRNVDIVKVDNSGTIRALQKKLEKQLAHRGY